MVTFNFFGILGFLAENIIGLFAVGILPYLLWIKQLVVHLFFLVSGILSFSEDVFLLYSSLWFFWTSVLFCYRSQHVSFGIFIYRFFLCMLIRYSWPLQLALSCVFGRMQTAQKPIFVCSSLGWIRLDIYLISIILLLLYTYRWNCIFIESSKDEIFRRDGGFVCWRK